MNVLLLTGENYDRWLKPIYRALELESDSCAIDTRPLLDGLIPYWSDSGIELVVSYGYRHIIKEPWLSEWKDRIVNIHISYLPYNRGASPNLWSWYDDTPKGVSIHRMDAGIDTGELLYRRSVAISVEESLASSYQILQDAAGALFFGVWPALRRGHVNPYSGQPLAKGSYHTIKESQALLAQFPLGYETVCAEVRAAGMEARRCRDGDTGRNTATG